MPSPEELAREKIDPLLEDCGWLLQNRSTINLSASRGVALREALLKGRDEADYLLFVDGKAIGTKEAKPEGHTLIGVEEQSGKYGKNLLDVYGKWRDPLPFAYESTGVETQFTNRLDPDPKSRNVFAFHKFETLLEWLQPEHQLNARLANLLNTDQMPTTNLWSAQIEAIRNLEVYLSADAAQVRVGESVIFSISTNDGRTHEYRLNFGDQSPVVQTRKNRIPHTFKARGNCTVSVTVLDDPSHPGDEVRIRIGPPRPPGLPSWTYVVVTLAAAVLFYKILKRATRRPPVRPPPPPHVPPLLTFHPHWDSSTAPTKRQENIAVNYELHFDPNVSKGRYQLEIRGPVLVTSMRRNNA